MKRAEFIKTWSEIRKDFFGKQVDSGKMRLSEAIMALADLPREAAKLWRKHRGDYSKVTVEEFKRLLSK